MENTKIATPWPGAIATIVVGLALAYALFSGLNALAQAVRLKNFTSSPASPPPFKSVVPLSGDRFAVVKDNQIEVFRIDGEGKVHREDDAMTYYRDLQPVNRRENPTPTPEPSPAPVEGDQ